MSRHYKLGLTGSLTFGGRLQTVRRFYEKQPRWLVAQLGIVALTTGLGVWGLFVVRWVGVILLVVTLALAYVALRLPGWRERVDERRPDT